MRLRALPDGVADTVIEADGFDTKVDSYHGRYETPSGKMSMRYPTGRLRV